MNKKGLKTIFPFLQILFSYNQPFFIKGSPWRDKKNPPNYLAENHFPHWLLKSRRRNLDGEKRVVV
jgi:hypothetical protein